MSGSAGFCCTACWRADCACAGEGTWEAAGAATPSRHHTRKVRGARCAVAAGNRKVRSAQCAVAPGDRIAPLIPGASPGMPPAVVIRAASPKGSGTDRYRTGPKTWGLSCGASRCSGHLPLEVEPNNRQRHRYPEPHAPLEHVGLGRVELDAQVCKPSLKLLLEPAEMRVAE